MTHRASDFPPKQVECRTGAELERKWLGGFRLEINWEKRRAELVGMPLWFLLCWDFLMLFLTFFYYYVLQKLSSSTMYFKILIERSLLMWIKGFTDYSRPMKPFSHWNPELWGLGRQILGHFGYFRPNYQHQFWYSESLLHIFNYSTIISSKN